MKLLEIILLSLQLLLVNFVLIAQPSLQLLLVAQGLVRRLQLGDLLLELLVLPLFAIEIVRLGRQRRAQLVAFLGELIETPRASVHQEERAPSLTRSLVCVAFVSSVRS